MLTVNYVRNVPLRLWLSGHHQVTADPRQMTISELPKQRTEHFDVLIVGAGISGIGAAAHLERSQPGKSYAVLEARDAIGGTWDLFRYPGIRSDSDLHTFGYAFKPWTDDKAIADGDSIRAYIEETAHEYGVDRHIRFGHRMKARVVVERGRSLDHRGRARRHR